MKVLLTGCAGFIGAKVAEMLLKDNVSVIGVDNLNDYYDPKIKEFRLQSLNRFSSYLSSFSETYIRFRKTT